MMGPIERQNLMQAMQMVGLDPRLETNVEQFAVMVETMRVFQQKNGKYKDLWQEYGIEDLGLHLRSKSSRVERAQDPEDAIDLINYSVFMVRLLRDKA